jgi:hypothetical protein
MICSMVIYILSNLIKILYISHVYTHTPSSSQKRENKVAFTVHGMQLKFGAR